MTISAGSPQTLNDQSFPPKAVNVTLTQHGLELVTLALGGAVLAAFLLDAVDVPLRPWSVGPLVFLLVVCFAWNFLHQQKHGFAFKLLRSVSWDWSELAVFSLIVGGFLTYAVWLGWPSLLPVGTTVDAVHQYGLADYINQTGRLPLHALEQRANLQDGLQYPPVFVILVSLLSQLTGYGPVYLLHPLVAGLAAIATGTTFAVVSLLLQGKIWRLPLAALAAGAVLWPYGYTFASFISQTYYEQITAEAFLMLSLFFLLRWRLYLEWSALALFGLNGAVLIVGYPTLALIPLTAFGVAALLGRDVPTKKIILAVIYGPLGVLAILFLKDRLATGLGTLSNEGDVLSPDLSRYGWPVVIAAGFGLVQALLVGSNLARITALFCGLYALEGGGLWLLKAFLNHGSYYAVYKMFYPAVYLWPILAAIGLSWWFERLNVNRAALAFSPKGQKKFGLGLVLTLVSMGLFGISLVSTWITHPQTSRPFATITSDNVNVAEWMRSNLKLSEYNVGYNLVSGASAYWLQVGFFKQPRDVHSNDLLQGEPLTFEGWFYAPDSPQYLITDQVERLALDERCRILYRSGDTAVLTHTPAYTQEAGLRPNLAVQYKAELASNLLSLRIETTMSKEPSNWLAIGLAIAPGDTAQPLYTVAAPAEKGRAKKQFLGVVLNLPSLEVRELYSNNEFPEKPKAPTALPPGNYTAFVVLQKYGSIVERRKLLNFAVDANGRIDFDQTQHVILGQFLFEGVSGQTLPLSQPHDLQLNGESLQLTALDLPAKVAPNTNFSSSWQWQLPTSTLHNYRFQWLWLNANGAEAGRSESLPLNGLYPTWLWPEAEFLVIRQELKSPAQAGRYQLGLRLVEVNSGEATQLVKLPNLIEVGL